MQLNAGGFPTPGKLLCQRGDQVGEKSLGITIQEIEREPADRHVHVACQIDQERGFAIAGRSRKKQELVFKQCLQNSPAGGCGRAAQGADEAR